MSLNSTQPVVTASNYGPVVNVLNWMLITVSVLAVLARLYTKLRTHRQLGIEDVFMIIALVCSGSENISLVSHTILLVRFSAPYSAFWSLFKSPMAWVYLRSLCHLLSWRLLKRTYDAPMVDEVAHQEAVLLC